MTKEQKRYNPKSNGRLKHSKMVGKKDLVEV